MNMMIAILATFPALIGVVYAEGNKRQSSDHRNLKGPLDQKKAWSIAATIFAAQAICGGFALLLVTGF